MPALTAATIRRRLSRADPLLGRVIAAAGPLKLTADPGSSPFRHLARAIAHQQLNGTAANTILRRFVALYREDGAGSSSAERRAPPEPVLADYAATRDALFPTPAQVLATADTLLRGVGFSFAKIAALKDLSAKALDGVVPDTATLLALGDEAIIERLTAVRGIGRWTVEMMLMFQLGRPDVLPVDDFGVRNGFRLAYGLRGLPTPRALARYGAIWAPHRSAASWYLWRAVDLARDGRLPEPLRPAPRVAVAGRRKTAAARGRGSAPVRRAGGAASAARRPRSGARTR
jgi:DNA-3-methyladenine glycosylase II